MGLTKYIVENLHCWLVTKNRTFMNGEYGWIRALSISRYTESPKKPCEIQPHLSTFILLCKGNK